MREGLSPKCLAWASGKPWARINLGIPNLCSRTRVVPNSLHNWICGCGSSSQYRDLVGIQPGVDAPSRKDRLSPGMENGVSQGGEWQPGKHIQWGEKGCFWGLVGRSQRGKHLDTGQNKRAGTEVPQPLPEVELVGPCRPE